MGWTVFVTVVARGSHRHDLHQCAAIQQSSHDSCDTPNKSPSSTSLRQRPFLKTLTRNRNPKSSKRVRRSRCRHVTGLDDRIPFHENVGTMCGPLCSGGSFLSPDLNLIKCDSSVKVRKVLKDETQFLSFQVRFQPLSSSSPPPPLGAAKVST